MATTTQLTVEPITASFGAVMRGIDLTGALDQAVLAGLHDAVVRHGVVVVPGQPIDDEQQLRIARHWGDLDVFPVFRAAGQNVPLEWVEDTPQSPPKAFRWHTDIPWEPLPPKFGVLAAKVVPDVGGDTIWADTAAAYDALSPTMQQCLAGLWVHYKIEPGAMNRFTKLIDDKSAARFRAEYANGVDHPLVRRNADDGRLALFVAGYWMDHIVGMSQSESDALFGFLMDHVTQPRFQCRWRWAMDDLIIWDERRTMHIAMADHYPQHRKLRRCTIAGEAPLAAD